MTSSLAIRDLTKILPRHHSRQTLIRSFTNHRYRTFANAALQQDDLTTDRSDIAPINLEASSNPDLFHRQIDVRLRVGHKRATRQIRNDGTWIPCIFQGRGLLPDMLLQMQVKPLQQDVDSRYFAIQKLGASKLTGPLYEMRVINGGTDDTGNLLPIHDISFERVRVIAKNMELHYITGSPISVGLVYAPEDKPIRVRVPLRFINEEKASSLKDGGWLNRLHQSIDIDVAPFVKAPLYATLDIAGMKMKEKRFASDIVFEGKGEGCRTTLEEDTPVVMVSKI